MQERLWPQKVVHSKSSLCCILLGEGSLVIAMFIAGGAAKAIAWSVALHNTEWLSNRCEIVLHGIEHCLRGVERRFHLSRRAIPIALDVHRAFLKFRLKDRYW